MKRIANALILFLCLAGCGHDEGPANDNGKGSLSIGFAVAGGSDNISTLTYTVDDSTGTQVYTSTIHVGTDPGATLSAEVFLSVGTGYTVTAQGTTDQGVTCSSNPSAPFNIVSQQVTNVSVSLLCGTPTGTNGGNAAINVNVVNGQVPLPVMVASASALQVTTGQPIYFDATCSQAAFATSPTTNSITDPIVISWWDITDSVQLNFPVVQTGDNVTTDIATASGTWTCPAAGTYQIQAYCLNADPYSAGQDVGYFTVTCL